MHSYLTDIRNCEDCLEYSAIIDVMLQTGMRNPVLILSEGRGKGG